MKQNIQICLSSTLKGNQSQIGQLHLRPKTVLKISQNNSHIYTKYQPNPNLPQNKCNLSHKLCQYNNITQGFGLLFSQSNIISTCKTAKIYVNKLDWQIINNKSHKLEQQFLNQFDIIWPNALLPLYYDMNNCVCLRVQCQRLSQLKENTQLEILIDHNDENGMQQNNDKQANNIKIIQLNDKNIKNMGEYTCYFGNINSVYLPQQIGQNQVIPIGQQWQYWIQFIQSSKMLSQQQQQIPNHTYVLSIQQQLNIIKGNVINNSLQDKKQKVFRYPIIRIEENQQQQMMRKMQKFTVSKLLRKYWKIGQKLGDIKIKCVKSQQKNKKKLRFLLNSMKNFNIVLETIIKDQQNYSKEQLKTDFIQELCQYLQNHNKICIYQKIPFCINKIPYFINLYEGNKKLDDPLIITHNNTQSSNKNRESNKNNKIQIDIKQKLNACLKIHNLFYDHQISPENKIKIKSLLQLQRKRLQTPIKESQFKKMYKINYSKQIQTIKNNLLKMKMMLISSFSNNGKTILHEILLQEGYQVMYIDMGHMDNEGFTAGDIGLFLETVFQEWKGEYLFLDNIDSVCYNIDSGDLHRRQQKIASKLIARKIINFSKIYNKYCILTAKNQTNLDEEFKGYFHIKLKNPTLQSRLQVLKQATDFSEQKIQELGKTSESMSFGEFVKYALTGVKGQAKDSLTPKFDFSKLAGLKQAKKMIRSVVEKPLRYSFVFKKLPVKLSRGILLYGGSGTGKTAVGQALADQFSMKFFSVKGSDILSKYIGGSEAAVRDIFEKAMSVSPSIIFFDQFETIVPRRNSSNTGVTDRVVNQFLCYLDGVASIEGVFIVAASSRPDMIDPALLRPGRIDSHIYLSYPKREQRQELLTLYQKSIQFDLQQENVLDITQNFSYSDMVGLIKQLRIKKSAQILKQSDNVDSSEFKKISKELFEQTVRNYRISVNKKEQEKQQKVFQTFKNGGAPDISKQKTMLG